MTTGGRALKYYSSVRIDVRRIEDVYKRQVYYATGSRAKGALYALASGLAEPAGALLAFSLLRGFLTPLFLNGLIALIAGVMLYVSFSELMPQAFATGKRAWAVGGLCVGTLIMDIGIYLV